MDIPFSQLMSLFSAASFLGVILLTKCISAKIAYFFKYVDVSNLYDTFVRMRNSTFTDEEFNDIFVKESIRKKIKNLCVS